MTTNDTAIAVADPEDAGQRIADLTERARFYIERAYVAYQANNKDAGNDALVVAHSHIDALADYGRAATQTIIGLNEAMQEVIQQRDQAIDQRVDLEGSSDELVAERVEQEAEYIEESVYDNLDVTEIAAEHEDNWLYSIRQSIDTLRVEGDIDGADRLEELVGVYIQARDALSDAKNNAEAALLKASNERRVAAGLTAVHWYTPPGFFDAAPDPDDTDDDDTDDDSDN